MQCASGMSGLCKKTFSRCGVSDIFINMNVDDGIELFGVPHEELEDFFESIGERRFRARQVCKWIYGRGEFDFSKMTDLPAELRKKLSEISRITLLDAVEVARAEDGSAKFLFSDDENRFFEAVYIPDERKNKHTVCLSSQVGCKFGCKFCATGKMGFLKNLTSTEIIGQLHYVREYIRQGGNDLTNVVFMGMGEPCDNIDAVLDAISVIVSQFGFGLGHRRVLVSTVGIPEGIEAIMKSGLRPKLAISLNAPDQRKREKIMPVAKKYLIDELMKIVPEYARYSKRWVTFEYVMFRDFNDSLEDARELLCLIKNLPAKVNLIPFNPVAGVEFYPPDDRIVLRFQSYLLANSVVATIRRSKGRDVSGACGQLAGKYSLR